MDDEEAPGAGPGLFSWADGTPLAVRAPIAAVSTYLNLMRLVAAALVFVSHASFRQVSDKLLWQIGDFGQQAVTVFFVLSGFVIAYVTHQRETDAGTYALHRAARIYSVAIPTLLLTLMLDSVNCHYGQSAWMTAQCTISGGFPILWVWRFWARSGALIWFPAPMALTGPLGSKCLTTLCLASSASGGRPGIGSASACC
ncbi:MAG: acyltransferase family protein [Rhodopila sp.]